MPPKKLIGKVISKVNLVGDIWVVRFSFEEKIELIPGQYISLRVSPEGMRRSYSVAKVCGENSIELLIDVFPMGVGSRYILGLNLGDSVEILGFLGNFVVDSQQLKGIERVLFIGTGSGIAPLKPMAENLIRSQNFSGETRLIWGMRNEESLYWLEEFEELASGDGNFKFDLVLSKPSDDWRGSRGHVGDVVATITDKLSNTLVYLCGSPEMINEMEEILEKNGVPGNQIFYEKYY